MAQLPLVEWWQSWLAGGAAVLLLMTLIWLLSVKLRDASVVDSFWGPGFLLATVVYWQTGHAYAPRGILVVILVTIWGLRLAWHIARRNHGKGEDPRYQAFRAHYGPGYWWISFFQVYLLQGALLWIISIPLLAAQWSAVPAEWTVFDAVGCTVFGIGLLFEAVGDAQLAAFKKNPANQGQVMTQGLWRYTRHPNYFGDAVVWWGLFLVACSTGAWLTVLSPVLMTTLLTRVSGVSLLERTMSKRPGYAEYIARTSSFFPRPPRTPVT